MYQIIKPKWLKEFSPLVKMIRDNTKEARFVGGCVRDTILKREVNDFDLATNAKPQCITEILQKNNIRVIPTGLKHGTITAIWMGKAIEITTLRYDTKCDGRYAEVEFTDSWQEDAKRRDFTFNALYLDIDGNIYDYFHGVEDLKNGRLRFVGDPKTRIEEDYLRILRAFRFHANICTAQLDEEILKVCTQLKERINLLSGERIRCEMIKLLSYKNALFELVVMQNCGVLQVICGFSLDFSKITIPHAMKDPFVRLALLIKNCNMNPQNVLEWLNKRWKFSKKEYQKLGMLINSALGTNLKKDILNFDKQNTKDLVLIKMAEGKISPAEANETITAINLVNIAPFPVLGRDIIPFGYQGRAVGQVLDKLKQEWEKTDYTATKKDLLAILTNQRC